MQAARGWSVRTVTPGMRQVSLEEARWDDEFGKLYRRLYRIRHAILKVPEEKVSKMIADAAKLNTHKMSLKDVFTIVLKTHPQLLLEVAPYFLGQ